MPQSLIGASLKRVEDAALLRGNGAYLDDLRIDGLLHIAFVRSPYPHARVLGIDAGAALAAPGVVAVLTREELGGATLDPPQGPPGTVLHGPVPLADGVVRFVGEPVAAVVAESAALAADGAALVDVAYDPLPSVGTIEEAMRPGAPAVHPDAPDNVCFRVRQSTGDVAGIFAAAAHRVAVRLRRHRVAGVPIEPRGLIVRPEGDGGLTFWASCQAPHRLRDSFARALGLDRGAIRGVAPDVGGGFGVKTALTREDLVTAVAARRLGRPVKWVSTRIEDFLTTQHARDQLDEIEGAFDAEGRLQALRIRTAGAVGAYSVGMSANLFLRMILFSAGPYRVAAQEAEVTGYYLNTNHTGAMRGAGRPEASTAGERLMQAAARVIGIDPVELRRRNFIPPDAFPYTNPSGTSYDSGDYPGLLAHALDVSDYAGLLRERDARRAAGELVGVGLATFVEMTGAGPETGRVLAQPDGTVTAFVGSNSQGQGHKTVFPQIVATLLDVPYAAVRLVQSDTALVPEGTGTFGSRSTVAGGGALAEASSTLKARALAIAAEAFEVTVDDLEWRDGMAVLRGTPERQLSLGQIAGLAAEAARRAAEAGDRVGAEAPPAHAAPDGAVPEGLHAETVFDARRTAQADVMAAGAYVAVVAVDRETGRVRVERFVAVDDSGTVVNPLITDGQIHGSLAHGVGEALWERMVYDAEGQVQTASFLDYAMPTAHAVPGWTLGHYTTPSPQQPFGAKGAGEAGNIGGPPAVINAVLDALAPLGVTALDPPLHDERIWRLIRAAGRR